MNLDHCKDTLNLALTIKKKKCTANLLYNWTNCTANLVMS
jgi:hypothetical protein